MAVVLHVVQYSELLCEMAAKRRGERLRWRIVVLIEAVKALCRLVLLRITRSGPSSRRPCPSDNSPVPEPAPDDDDDGGGDDVLEQEADGDAGAANGHADGSNGSPGTTVGGVEGKETRSKEGDREWIMPRTGMSLPALPQPGDTSAYLLSRVLTADDIKPAARLLNRLRGAAQVAEVLHILAPHVYAVALARSSSKSSGKKSPWTPWLIA